MQNIIVLVLLWFGGSWVYNWWNTSSMQNDMLEVVWDASPQLKRSYDNLRAEIERLQERRERFVEMQNAAQTKGGKKLAGKKISRIDSELLTLNGLHQEILEEAEKLAMETMDTFTELDKQHLQELANQADVAVSDASMTRKQLGR